MLRLMLVDLMRCWTGSQQWLSLDLFPAEPDAVLPSVMGMMHAGPGSRSVKQPFADILPSVMGMMQTRPGLRSVEWPCSDILPAEFDVVFLSGLGMMQAWPGSRFLKQPCSDLLPAEFDAVLPSIMGMMHAGPGSRSVEWPSSDMLPVEFNALLLPVLSLEYFLTNRRASALLSMAIGADDRSNDRGPGLLFLFCELQVAGSW